MTIWKCGLLNFASSQWFSKYTHINTHTHTNACKHLHYSKLRQYSIEAQPSEVSNKTPTMLRTTFHNPPQHLHECIFLLQTFALWSNCVQRDIACELLAMLCIYMYMYVCVSALATFICNTHCKRIETTAVAAHRYCCCYYSYCCCCSYCLLHINYSTRLCCSTVPSSVRRLSYLQKLRKFA